MIAKGADVLLQFMPTVPENKRKLIADVLLKEFEREGMLPPLVQLSHINAKDNGWEIENN